MTREKELIKNTVIFFIGNFASKFLVFLMLPFYTIYLTQVEFGYYDIVLSTIMVLVPIITFQLADGMYRNLLDSKDDNDVAKCLSNSFYIIFRNILIFVIAGIVFVNFVRIQYGSLIIIQTIATILMSIWQQIARGLKKNKEYSLSSIIYTFLMLVLNIGLVKYFGLKVDGLLYANIISCVLAAAYLEIKLGILRKIKFNTLEKVNRVSLLAYSLPLLPTAINWWVLSSANRYVIGAMLGQSYNGIFAVTSKFPSILLMVNNIFYLAWQESAISEYNSADKDAFYTKMFNLYAKIQLSVLIILLPITKIAIELFIDSKFQSSWQYVPLLYLGSIFLSFAMFYGTGYLSSKETKGAFTTTLVSSIVNIFIVVVTIPLLGLQGVSLASAVSYLTLWVIRIFQTRKYFKINIDKKVMALLLGIIGIYIFIYYLDNKSVDYISSIMAFVVFSFINLDLIKKAVELVKTKLLKVGKI